MIVRHTGHLIEFCATAIPNSPNWAATVLVSSDLEGHATYTSSTVRQTVLLLRKTVNPGE